MSSSATAAARAAQPGPARTATTPAPAPEDLSSARLVSSSPSNGSNNSDPNSSFSRQGILKKNNQTSLVSDV